MSRLYISADLEGICGVVNLRQCSPEPERPAYDEAVGWFEEEVSAVAETALAEGATEIVVNDAHCGMTNLRLGRLDPRISLISGKPKRCAMVAGLDDRFDAMILIGYHAKAGTHRGVLSHTFHHHLFDVSVNGVSYGEGGINALYASLVHDVPLVLASGDEAFKSEIQTIVPSLPVVETKVGLGHAAARCHPREQVLADYRGKTREVMRNQADWRKSRLELAGPYELRLTFNTPLDADAANLIPGLERLDGRTIGYQTTSFEQLYQTMQSCYTLLASVSYLQA